jgi:hypothetical protein
VCLNKMPLALQMRSWSITVNILLNILEKIYFFHFSNNYAHGSNGPDYVDYGAYTGGNGAYGWYSDHPVGGGYHR